MFRREKLPSGEPMGEYFHPGDRVIVKATSKNGWINEIVVDNRTHICLARVYLDKDERPTYFNLNEIEKDEEE